MKIIFEVCDACYEFARTGDPTVYTAFGVDIDAEEETSFPDWPWDHMEDDLPYHVLNRRCEVCHQRHIIAEIGWRDRND